MTRILGIDVGGTFTDFVYHDPSKDKLIVWKTLSTPQDPGKGILDGLQNQQIGGVDYLRFGTTIATNAILERNGATVAFVTTLGFKDVPFIQRGKRQSHYDINWIKSKPLVKRRHCFEIDERITPREGVYKALDEDQVRNVAKQIASNPEIEAIAICLLCSYVTPEHEIRVREIFKKEIPNKPISISYDLLPKWKEHERSSTTIADAYLKPLVSENLKKLGDKLSAAKDIKRVSVIKSNGGEVSLEGAKNCPIHLSLSGPTGGVIGARQLSNLIDIDHIVTLDMGGTSTDVSTVVGGTESFTTSYEIEFGIPIQIPMIDIRTMGAGGGSVAWIDKGGMLQVGPQSAGADPGPACYDRGGELPTVTDANVVLGRINPQFFLGGNMELSVDKAKSAVESIAKQLGETLENTANGIVKIANNNMVGATRLVLTEKGLDPRDFTMLAFGGAGPVHISDLMQLAGTPSGIVPNHPGQFSAFGFTMTDARIDLERTAPMTSRFFNFEYANRVLNDLVKECSEALVQQGYTEKIEVLKTLEMRYFGQNHELEIPFYDDAFTENKISSVWGSFHQAHKTRYNFDIPNETIELISIKVTALAITPKPQMPTRGSHGELPSPCEKRMVFFDDGKAPAAVYRREEIPVGKKFLGPALIEEDASVTVVSPDMPVLIDEYGNIVLGKLAAEYNN